MLIDINIIHITLVFKVSYKQEINGKKGEARTFAIMAENFIIHKITPDIQGRDFMVELHGNISTVQAIIQSKYFESNNEVIIRKEYVWDEDGVKTDFFAFLHSDEDLKEVCYFFSAQEIHDNWRLSSRKKGRKVIDYYAFKLTNKDSKKWSQFKGIAKSEINNRIESGIRRTEEYRNQKNIRSIQEQFKNPTQQIFENRNAELFKRLSDKPILDKLYIALSEFNDFRRIISWRLVDKISFRENTRTQTYYNHFTLSTNNKMLLAFFENIEIGESIVIKERSQFEGILDVNNKLLFVIQRLNENLIFYLNNLDESTNKWIVCCADQPKCLDYDYDRLAFSKVYSSAVKIDKTSNLWLSMNAAYVLFMLGKYKEAKELYTDIAHRGKESKEEIVSFFSKLNKKNALIKNLEFSVPDLNIELDKLNISQEKREIMKSLADETLFNAYSISIDEVYLKIKDYKQRNIACNTNDLINRIYSSIAEYTNFTDGNWLVVNHIEDSNLMFEKVIECCIISYSMKTEYTSHLNSFNDFLVQIAIHYCDSSKLLGWFERNHVDNLPYESNANFLQTAIDNFFSHDNINFLQNEICYFNGRTENPDLNRKVRRIFNNICILVGYLNFEFESGNFIKKAIHFIQKMDYNSYEVGFLAVPLVIKTKLFSEIDIVVLIRTLFSRDELLYGNILTNCLTTLQEKGFIFPGNENELTEKLIQQAIKEPKFNLLRILPKTLGDDAVAFLKSKIEVELEENFNDELYYEAVFSGTLENPRIFFVNYLNMLSPLSEKEQKLSFFKTPSPFTGMREPLRTSLNKLAEIFYLIGDSTLIQHSVLLDLTSRYPYYNFIFNYGKTSIDDFNVPWLLENQSGVIMRRLAANELIGQALKSYLKKKHNSRLSKIYFEYFT